MLKGSAIESLNGVFYYTGSHEPLMFRRRTWGGVADEEERFKYEHSEEAVKAIAKRGITWIRWHFFKGFGLKHEAEEIEMTKKFTKLCHEHDIRVQLYTQWGTLQYETFLDEEPDVEKWVQVDFMGQHPSVNYGPQMFRWLPCATRDGYWEYLKKVVEVGIKEVHGDGFGFDNVGLAGEPASCHCPDCRAGFVKFLKEKYRVDTEAGRALAKERFGFSLLDHIQPPVYTKWVQPIGCYNIQNPVMQEWTEFRCETVRMRLEQMQKHIRLLSKDVVIEYNVYPAYGFNAAFWGGVDMVRVMPYLDAFFNEQDRLAEYTDDGRLINRTRSYKLARASGKKVFIVHGHGRSPEQRLLSGAESMVFNSGLIGGVEYLTSKGAKGCPEMDDLFRFRRDCPELFGGKPDGEVAFFESARSLSYSSIEVHYSNVLAYQGLTAGHIPFEIVSDEKLSGVDNFKVLVLPNVECITDEMRDRIVSYVKSGGGFVMTDHSGMYDKWRRRLPQNALAVLFSEELKGDVVRAEAGRGRVVYIPKLQEVRPYSYRPEDWYIDPRHWHRPKNWKELVSSVIWAAGGKFDFSVKAPEWIVTDPQSPATGGKAIHILNYKAGRTPKGVTLTLKWNGKTPSATLYQSACEPKAVKTRAGKAVTTITLPAFGYYGVVLVK